MGSCFLSVQWQINSEINGLYLWYHLKSVLTEDLIFRSDILYIVVSMLGIKTGIILSAIVFGIYHWFSYGLLPGDSRLISLMYVFTMTGFAAFVWAYAYIKTCSIMMPLGSHLGSILVLGLCYENNPYGEPVFFTNNPWLNSVIRIHTFPIY